MSIGRLFGSVSGRKVRYIERVRDRHNTKARQDRQTGTLPPPGAIVSRSTAGEFWPRARRLAAIDVPGRFTSLPTKLINGTRRSDNTPTWRSRCIVVSPLSRVQGDERISGAGCAGAARPVCSRYIELDNMQTGIGFQCVEPIVKIRQLGRYSARAMPANECSFLCSRFTNEDVRDVVRGMTVAVHVDLAAFGIFGAAPKPIPAGLDGLDPFRGVPERHARLAVKIGFLLQAAGIGQRPPAAREQRGHVEITHRVNHEQARSNRSHCVLRPLACADEWAIRLVHGRLLAQVSQ